MKFIDKRTNEILEANSYTKEFALSHNSNYELVEEGEVSDELNLDETNQDDLEPTDIDNENNELTQKFNEEIEDNSDTEDNVEENKDTEKNNSKKGKKPEKKEIEEGEVSDEVQK